MKFILSRYNHDMSWMKDYPEAEFVIYDRSEEPIEGSIVMPNAGSDIYDKLTYIIDNYDNLPDVAIYSKANIFKYISKEEFDALDKTKFQPLLTQHHKTKMPIAYYEDDMYHEINNYWYLIPHPAKYAANIKDMFKMNTREYNAFAPGSNYILPKENILQHPKKLYQQLRSYLDWSIYPGDAQLLERNLYYLWKL